MPRLSFLKRKEQVIDNRTWEQMMLEVMHLDGNINPAGFLIPRQTLFISIPNFLDMNPFSDDDQDGDIKTRGMDSVVSVFQMTYDLLHDLEVHPDITSQLFAYLLFFTNASLFNMLLERGKMALPNLDFNQHCMFSAVQEPGIKKTSQEFFGRIQTHNLLLVTVQMS